MATPKTPAKRGAASKPPAIKRNFTIHSVETREPGGQWQLLWGTKHGADYGGDKGFSAEAKKMVDSMNRDNVAAKKPLLQHRIVKRTLKKYSSPEVIFTSKKPPVLKATGLAYVKKAKTRTGEPVSAGSARGAARQGEGTPRRSQKRGDAWYERPSKRAGVKPVVKPLPEAKPKPAAKTAAPAKKTKPATSAGARKGAIQATSKVVTVKSAYTGLTARTPQKKGKK